MDKTLSLARYRWAVASRSIAALFGGYALAAAWAICMSLWLQRFGMARMDAVTTAGILSFVVQVCAVIWVFAVTSMRRAWAGILIPTALLALGAWLAGAAA